MTLNKRIILKNCWFKIYYKNPQLKNWGDIFLKPIIKTSLNGFHPYFLPFFLLGQPLIPS